MQRMKEWATGKAGTIADRVYKLLSKYTGIQFKICPILHSYKNKWGTFLGRVALGSNGRFYRLNFSRGSSDEIVSMDVWAKGVDPTEKSPEYTCSLEGYGISRTIYYLVDFIKDPQGSLTENYELGDYGKINFQETMKEVVAWTAEFLAQSPQWQQAWGSNGNVDVNIYTKEFKDWIKINNRKFTGPRPPTKNEIIVATKRGLSSGAAVQAGVPAQNIATMAKGAGNVPSVAVVKSSAAGTEQPLDISDIYEEKVTFDQIQAGMLNNKDGPLAQMEDMHEAIVTVIEMQEYGPAMAVIWGRGGIGKSHTFEEVMEGKGLTEGVGYKYLPQSLNGVTEGSLQKWIIDNGKVPVICIDDNDGIFQNKDFINTWKQALSGDARKGRCLRVAYRPGYRLKPGEPPEGTYQIECKFVWLSNIDPDSVFNDPSGAMASRYFAVEYNFTDEEVMAIIADKLSGIYPEFDDVLTPEDRARIFNIFWKASLKRKTQGVLRSAGVSFRDFNAALAMWWYKKSKGVSFDKYFRQYLSKKLKLTH